MTLSDRSFGAGESPWEEHEDIVLQARGVTGKDVLLTVNLRPSISHIDYEFKLYRGEPPMPSDRFRVEARGNVVQLTLQHASRDDAGHYALTAKRLPAGNESERLFSRRIHMSVDEPSFTEEGDPPLFLRRLIDLTVKVGTRTRFLVEIRSATDPKVTWHRNDEPIQAGPRFSFVHEGNFYCVDVAPVTVEDQGHWTCMAENRSGRSSCTSHLNVLVPKAYKKPDFVSELRAILTETGTVSLECKVIGVPTPVLKWFKDNKEIKAGDVFALTANPDDPTSLGTYTCEAVNCMGIAYSSSRVHVVGKGSREGSLKPADTLIVTGNPPIFKRILKDESCKIAENLSLSCQVQIPPWPKEIAWYNKEGRVEASERYKIMEDGLGGYSIHVEPVEAVDEGEWKCVATSSENVKQFTTCYVAISIPKNYRKPRFMESLKAVLTEEGLVSFECKVVGFPTPLLKWFKDGQELKPGDVYQLTGTNSLGSYCCIARNCMGEAKSTAELTVEDIQNQLNEDERLQLLTINQPPKFIKGLRSSEAKINENYKFSVQVSVMPEPSLSWYRDDYPVDNKKKYRMERESLDVCHLEIQRLEFCDQAEWKCVASNDFGQSVTSCFLKLIIPKHYKKPKFLENLRAILSEGGAVNLECKVIGVPQPLLKWYKDGEELKPGDIHRIISGKDGTCCLGTYTCEATNCMGTVCSSASLLGFEDRLSSAHALDMNSPVQPRIIPEHELARNLSLSTIHEERTSQLLETAQSDHSVTLDDRGDVSFSFDGKEVSVSLYETPDLTEEEALQIVEMYADQLSEHVTEHNVVELPPMRFVKESSTSGNLLMEAVVIDVSPDYFVSINEGDDLCTEADVEDMSIMDGASSLFSPLIESIDEDRLPMRPARKTSESVSLKLQEQQESESYHSAKEPLVSFYQKKEGDVELDIDSEAYADALSLALTKTESNANEKHTRKRNIDRESSYEAVDSSFDSASETIRKKKKEENKIRIKRSLGEKGSLEDCSKVFDDKEKNTKILESVVSFTGEEDEQLSSKLNIERLVDLLRQISEPVLIIREALIDSDCLAEDENLINAFLIHNVVIPTQNLCELVADVETKALKNAGDRSLVQKVSISILETIGGPTEELLRGLELIKSQENEDSVRINLSILESLIDPVDEIIFGLAKLEFELSGRNINEGPVVLERIIRTAKRLEVTVQEINSQIGSSMNPALHKIHQILSVYLSNIMLNQFGGWTENIDAVLVESLAKPLEDLERTSKYIIGGNFSDETPELLERMSDAFNELLSRLDALVVALEGYESDYRTNFVVCLKAALVTAAEELEKTKKDKSNCFAKNFNLPEMILDSLIDAQTAINEILSERGEAREGKTKVLQNTELTSCLVELRKSVSYAVHKTTTLRKDEMIGALMNLKEPLIDLQLSLLVDQESSEILIIKSFAYPLASLQKVMQTVIDYIEKSESEIDILNEIKSICTVIEELKQQMSMMIPNFEEDRIARMSDFTETAQFQIENTLQQTINNLQIASELSTVHFELATILEKCHEGIQNLELSTVFSNITELRQSIGNAAIHIDKISTSLEPEIECFKEELLNLQQPLLKLQNILLIENISVEEQSPIICLMQSLERLKAVIEKFAEKVDQSNSIISIIDLIDDVNRRIAVYSTFDTKLAVEEELDVKSESYCTMESIHENLQENAEVKYIQVDQITDQALTKTNNNFLGKSESYNVMEHTLQMDTQEPAQSSLCTLPDPPDHVQYKFAKITDKHVIFPKEEFAFAISQSLQEIQKDIHEILEEFEQESVTTPHDVSHLAEALENLRRTIIAVRSNISQISLELTDVNSESSPAESYESAERISLSLKELLQPILEVREALIQTQDHKAPELLLLNRLDQPIRAIEFNVLQLALEAHAHTIESDETSSRASLDAMARALEEIESQIPVALDEVNSRQEILSTLRNVSKPLEVIRERIREISSDPSNEDNLEHDVANILGEAIDTFKNALNELFYRMESVEYQNEQNRAATLMLKYLIEPLVELQSSLSVVRSSRKISCLDAALLDERKNVILTAMKEVRFGIAEIRNEITKTTEITPLEKLVKSSIDTFDSAIVLTQNQINQTSYTEPRSSLDTLQQKTVEPLQQMAEKIAVIEEEMDKMALTHISEALEILWNQIQLAQIQFQQSSDQPLDEEAVIEGFLYPGKRLLSSLEILKEKCGIILHINTVNLLNELAQCTSNFGSTLLTLQNELIQEGVDKKSSIIETLTAVSIPLNNVQNLVNEISNGTGDKASLTQKDTTEMPKNNLFIYQEEPINESLTTEKAEINEKIPTIFTTVETIVDEFIEVSKRETESLTTLNFATEDKLNDTEQDQFHIANKVGDQILSNDNNTNRTNEGIDNSIIGVVESASESMTERRDSVTALWSIIKEPLENLQQSISFIMEKTVPFDENKSEIKAIHANIILEHLINLQTSIATMKKISSEDSEQITIDTWQRISLPALQNLASCLQQLGEHLPLLADQKVLAEGKDFITEEKFLQSTDIVTALKTLITPLQELRERLGLVVEEQVPYEADIADLEAKKIEEIRREKIACVEKQKIADYNESLIALKPELGDAALINKLSNYITVQEVVTDEDIQKSKSDWQTRAYPLNLEDSEEIIENSENSDDTSCFQDILETKETNVINILNIDSKEHLLTEEIIAGENVEELHDLDGSIEMKYKAVVVEPEIEEQYISNVEDAQEITFKKINLKDSVDAEKFVINEINKNLNILNTTSEEKSDNIEMLKEQQEIAKEASVVDDLADAFVELRHINKMNENLLSGNNNLLDIEHKVIEEKTMNDHGNDQLSETKIFEKQEELNIPLMQKEDVSSEEIIGEEVEVSNDQNLLKTTGTTVDQLLEGQILFQNFKNIQECPAIEEKSNLDKFLNKEIDEGEIQIIQKSNDERHDFEIQESTSKENYNEKSSKLEVVDTDISQLEEEEEKRIQKSGEGTVVEQEESGSQIEDNKILQNDALVMDIEEEMFKIGKEKIIQDEEKIKQIKGKVKCKTEDYKKDVEVEFYKTEINECQNNERIKDVNNKNEGSQDEQKQHEYSLWEIIQEPLDNLEKSISLILQNTSAIEVLNEVEIISSEHTIITECLVNLHRSIASLQNLEHNYTEEMITIPFEEKKLEAFQNLAISLEQFGKHLPQLAGQQEIVHFDTENVQELPDNTSVTNVLKIIVNPLHDFKDSLELIVDNKLPQMSKLTTIQSQTVEILKDIKALMVNTDLTCLNNEASGNEKQGIRQIDNKTDVEKEKLEEENTLGTLVMKPLKILNTSITEILHNPSAVEALTDAKVTSKNYTITESLMNLRKSITAMQNLEFQLSEKGDFYWNESNIEKLQDLAISLTQLGDHFPMIGSGQISFPIKSETLENLTQNNGPIKLLKMLVIPLNELKEYLQLIIEDHIAQTSSSHTEEYLIHINKEENEEEVQKGNEQVQNLRDKESNQENNQIKQEVERLHETREIREGIDTVLELVNEKEELDKKKYVENFKKEENNLLKKEEEEHERKKEVLSIKEEEREGNKTKEELKQEENIQKKEKENEKEEDNERHEKEQAEREKLKEIEKVKKNEKEREDKEKDERLNKEKEECQKKEEIERLKEEEEECEKKDKIERLRKDEKESKKKEENEKLQREEADRKEKEKIENLQKEEKDRKENEEIERLKKEEEEQEQKEETERVKNDKEEHKQNEDIERLKEEEKELKEKEEIESLKKEKEGHKKKEDVESFKEEELELKVKENIEILKKEDLLTKDEEDRKKQEELERFKKEEKEREEKEEIERLKKEEEDCQEKEVKEREAKEEAERQKKEENERKETEEIERLKKEEEDRKKREEIDKLLKEDEENCKKQEELEGLKKENECEEKEEIERFKKDKQERDEKAEIDRVKTEEERKENKEKERKAKEEAERQKKEEKECEDKEKNNRLKKEEEDRKEKEGKERKLKEENERQKKEENERKEKEEIEILKKEEEECKKKEDIDKLKKEKDRKETEEKERKTKEETEKQKEEKDREEKQKIERLVKEKQEPEEKEELERLKKEEKDREKKEEIERLEKEKEEREKKEKIDRLKKEEEKRKKQEELERLKKKEKEREEKAEIESLKKEKQEREEKEEIDRLKKEEEYCKKKEDKERKAKEEIELQKKEQNEGKEKEEIERLKNEEEECKEKEENDSLKKEEEYCKKKADKEGKAKAEIKLQKKEENERKEKEEIERLKNKEEECKREEEIERLKREEKEREEKKENERLQEEQEEHEKKEEIERLNKEKKDREEKEETERLKKEKQEREEKEEIDRLKKEEEDRKKQEELERLKKEKKVHEEKEEIERLKKEKEERERKEIDRLKKEEEDRKVKEEKERKAKEETERQKKEEKDREEKEEIERLNREKQEREEKENNDRLKKEEEDRKKQEELERLKKEEKEREEKEEIERLKQKKQEREEKEEIERLKKEEDRKEKEEKERKTKEEAERQKKEEIEREKKEEIERLKKEKQEREEKEENDRLRKEEEDRKKQEELKRLKREKKEREEKEEIERLMKEKQEREEKEENDRLKKEKEDCKKQEELERLKREKKEREEKEEIERLKKEKQEREEKEELERLKKVEDRKEKEEKERKAKEEAERQKKEEIEREEEEEIERLKKEKHEREEKEEIDRLKKEEEDRKVKEEKEREAKEETERQKKEEKDREEKEEIERLKKEKQEREEKENNDRLKKEEEDRKKQEELERLKREKKEREEKEEIERLKKEKQEHEEEAEIDRLKMEEDRKEKAEKKRKAKEEAERQKKEKQEREEKEEIDRLKKEEEDRKVKEEKEREAKEETERQKKEEKDREEKEEIERLKKEKQEREEKEDNDRLKKEEEDRKKQEKLESLKKEQKEREEKEEIGRLKKEEKEREEKEEIEKLNKEKVNEKKREKCEKLEKEEEGDKENVVIEMLKKEREERKQKEEIERLKKKKEELKINEEIKRLKKLEDAEGEYSDRLRNVEACKENMTAEKLNTQVKEQLNEEKRNKRKGGIESVTVEKNRCKLKGETANKQKRKAEFEKEAELVKMHERNEKMDGEKVIKGNEGRESEEKEVKIIFDKLKNAKPIVTKSESFDKSVHYEEKNPISEKEEVYSPVRKQNVLHNKERKFSSEAFYNKQRGIDNENPIRVDYKNNIVSERKYEPQFLSSSREDLFRHESDIPPLHTSLKSVTSIPDLTSAGRPSHGYNRNKIRDTYSTSSLNLETSIKKRPTKKSYEYAKNEFEYPSYTPKSIHTNNFSLSVSDSLALSRSRRRFELRNPVILSEGISSSKLTRNREYDRGKCPTFCTRLTDCTVAEGSHVRLICTTIGKPEPQVYWTKNGDRVRTGGRERIKYENGMAVLEIPASQLEDAGYYTCVAKNSHGQSSTEATVRVYSIYEYSPLGPTFTSSINDKYKRSDRELILETRVRGQTTPSISWLKDERLLLGDRYRQSLLGDGICRLQITEPDISDSGLYVCKATSDKKSDLIRHMVHFDAHKSGKIGTKVDNYHSDNRSYNYTQEREKLPRVSSSFTDYKVPAGGTIALQVEIKDKHAPNVIWLREHGERKEPITSSKIRTFAESGVYTLVVPEATESEAGTYVCRVSNAYGHVDTCATVEVIPLSKFDDLGKPAMFISRPADKMMCVMDGEAVSVSFRVSGTPKPRIVWMKGIRDITDGPRSHKEIIDDYIRLTLNRVNQEDEGTYCILVKNCYGCDRSFFTLKVRKRARSLTPTAERLSLLDRLSDIHIKEKQSYLKNVPGPISTEPIVVDGGRNWLSLSWGKADQRGPAPVIAYRVDAWQMGGDGGARWVELGISPINSYDAFNLRPGGEYKFRVTPKNRYGWGESVTMKGSATVSADVEIPEFTKILPGQLKALEGTTVKLECEVRSESKFDVKWLRETIEIDPTINTRYIVKNERSSCSLVLNNISEDDSGRYICEVSNKAGKVSSYGRVLVVNDPIILSAAARLNTRYLDGLLEDGPPQFTMRLRDRRVQTSYPVRLTCQVFGCPEPEVSWTKDGNAIVENSTRSIYVDESHFHTLEIARSSLEDSGCYTACASNTNGSVSCRCTLVVDKGIRAYVAPEFTYGLDAAYGVKIGGDLRLTAQIEAYPSVGVAWHRDGIRLRPRRRAAMTLSHDGTVELVLANVTCRDAGVYTCTASNEVGRAETSTRVSVTDPEGRPMAESAEDFSPQVVVNPPDVDLPYSKVPLFVTKPLSTEAQEGDTVIIQCEVVGDPKPEVVWLRDFLKPDYYRDAAHFRRIGAGPQYRLEIPHAKLDYTGTYSVVGRNEHGEAKAVISLQIYAKGQGKSDNMDKRSIKQGEVLSVPTITSELKDLRCCDGDAVTLECKVYAPSEAPNIRWEKSGKILSLDGDFSAEFDGVTAKLIIRHVYPEDEGEYTCVATNELGKAFTSACLVVDVPEGKENILSQSLLTKSQGLLSATSTPRSTPRSTPIRSLSPSAARGRELKAMNLPRRINSAGSSRRKPKVCPPKFYTIPHNRVAEEGETVRFQCAVAGHPVPWCSWDKDSVTVTSSARISIKEKDDVRILEIAEVTLEDAGLYRVTLENDVGRTEATARLEIINRNTLTPRPIRTRSASPRTYPTFSRSLLSTTTRQNGSLQLQCDIRGSPSPNISWFRNGSRIEHSSRVRRSFVGGRSALEISDVQLGDAGEYVCEAKNLLGAARSSCKVAVLEANDPSTKDRAPPKFLDSLADESMAMEGHSYELQARLRGGGSPLTVLWLKDGHEVVDSDYYRHVVYEDGGVALRFLSVHPLDAGVYTCLAKNEHGEATCRGLFVVQDYKSALSSSKLSFVKTPVSVFAGRGETACFCARTQSDRPVDVEWTINGKSVREDPRCKVERDGSSSILRISGLTRRDWGEVRCVASTSRGPAVSSGAQLRVRASASPPKPGEGLPRAHSAGSSTPNLRSRASGVGTKRASSYARLAPRPPEGQIDESIVDMLARERIITPIEPAGRNGAGPGRRQRQRRRTRSDEAGDGEESGARPGGPPTPALVLRPPADVTALRGSSVRLEAAYQGQPEPSVKWTRAGRDLSKEERTRISSRAGLSRLILDSITADQAGKYAVAVENAHGSDCRFASVAVEGPPEPPGEPPVVSPLHLDSGDRGASVAWCSPAYDGGCALTGYTVECRRVGELAGWRAVAENCHSLSHRVAGLRPGASYLFRVRALNVHGPGEPSPESRPLRVPHLDMDDAEDRLKVEEDQASMEEEFGEDEALDRLVTPEEGQLFHERYSLHEELGKGRYGLVRRVVERKSERPFAAKFVRTVKSGDRKQVREEIKIMNMLRHPKLLRLAAAFEGPKEIVMVMEYISGGELFERVVADDFTLTEKDSILFVRQICEGVRYMHENNIVHLDLKPENIMCHTRTSHRIKLIDFGLAQILTPHTPVRVLFGTPEFIPPEIINYEPIGTESDMWSVGVICYVLLTGLSPFMGDNDAETFTNIVRADYDFEDEAFDAISPDAKDFISNLLQKKKELRMSAKQCLSHSWLAQHTENMSRVALPTDKLKKFIVRRKWQKTGNALRALGRMAMLSASRRSPSLSPTSTRSLSEVTRSESLDSENLDDSSRKEENESLDRSVFESEMEKSVNHDEQEIKFLETSTEQVELSTNNRKFDQSDISSKESAKEKDEKEACYALHEDLEEDSRHQGADSADTANVFFRSDNTLDVQQKVVEFLALSESDNNVLTHDSSYEETSKCNEGVKYKPDEIIEENFHSENESQDEKQSPCNGSDELMEENKADEVIEYTDHTCTEKGKSVICTKLENDFYKKSVSFNSKTVENDSSSLKIEESPIKEHPGNGRSELQKVYNKEFNTADNFKQSKDLSLDRDLTRRSFRKFNTLIEENSNEDARLERSSSRGRMYTPTGNVSRTAKLFEKLESDHGSGGASTNNNNYKGNGVHSSANLGAASGKARSERIQRAFAFWNK